MFYGYTVTSNAGSITKNGNVYTINNVPIAQDLKLYLTSTIGEIVQNDTIIISPPNCNCPDIPEPTGASGLQVCQNLPASLTVSVQAGLDAKWQFCHCGNTSIYWFDVYAANRIGWSIYLFCGS